MVRAVAHRLFAIRARKLDNSPVYISIRCNAIIKLCICQNYNLFTQHCIYFFFFTLIYEATASTYIRDADS